jgi:hypothetical protein
LADSLKRKIKKDVTSQSIKVGASPGDAERKMAIKTSLREVSLLLALPADIEVSANPHSQTL